MDLGVYLLTSLLESVLMVYAGPALLGHRVFGRKAVALGSVLAALTIGVRLYYYYAGIPLGTHTLIFVALMILLLRYGSGLHWGVAVTGTVASLILVLLGGLLLSLTGVHAVAVGKFKGPIPEAGPWLILMLVEKSVLLLVALLVWLKGIVLVNLPWRLDR